MKIFVFLRRVLSTSQKYFYERYLEQACIDEPVIIQRAVFIQNLLKKQKILKYIFWLQFCLQLFGQGKLWQLKVSNV